MNPVKLLWCFRGRIGLLLNVAWTSAVLIGLIYLGRDEMLQAYPILQLGSLAIPLEPLFTGAKAVVITLFIWSRCGLMAKRLHDFDHNGWIWLVLLIPVVDVIAIIFFLIARGDDFDNSNGPGRNPADGPGAGARA